MVELWRFHQPAIVRDSEPSAKIFAITAKPIDEGFPLFFFFLFFFLLLSSPNPFFSPILYSLLR